MGAGEPEGGKEAVQQRLLELDAEAKEVAAAREAAYAKLEKALEAANPNHKLIDTLQKCYDGLAARRARLDQMRQDLHAKLANAGGSCTRAPADRSAELIADMMAGLPAISKLPETKDEITALLQERVGLKIPLPDTMLDTLAVDTNSKSTLRGVSGYHYAAATFAGFITRKPRDTGSEIGTSAMMFRLYGDVFELLHEFSHVKVPVNVRFNRTEHGAGSCSVSVGQWPNWLGILDMRTVLIGGDKSADKLAQALTDLKSYVKGGLNTHHYGSIPGLPTYAASGDQLKFCYVLRDGEVLALPTLRLDTVSGRISALCGVIHTYRLLALMAGRLPSLPGHMPLWDVLTRANSEVMLTPRGAVKAIPRFKAFAQAMGSSQEVLQGVYAAAGAAAAEQRQQGKQPFIVSAIDAPTFTRHGFWVRTQPLGYMSKPETEEEVRHMAFAACRAFQVLHQAGYVHMDIRPANVTRLTPSDWMLLDLECCRRATEPLPEGFCQLVGWDEGTLCIDAATGQRFYNELSDMYSIGRMIGSMLPQGCSALAMDFVRQLLQKALDSGSALAHQWFAGL